MTPQPEPRLSDVVKLEVPREMVLDILSAYGAGSISWTPISGYSTLDEFMDLLSKAESETRR